MMQAVAENEETKIWASPPDAKQQRMAVLCVDDDPHILEGFERNFRKRFRLHTAVGGALGLQAIHAHGPFAVVVSDFQMPGLDGIQFLTKVRELAPDTVRIMLTGQGDFSTAMAAVNQGNIFQFLIKPCTPLVLEKVLQSAVEQHRLLLAERQLTEQTLLGCVQVLVEVLSIVQPAAFSRAMRVRRTVQSIASGLGLTGTWQIEAAAMLSQIGWITLPPEIVRKASSGEPMSESEAVAYSSHTAAAARILVKIPRLDVVAHIIENQNSVRLRCGPLTTEPSHLVETGGQLLRAAIAFDSLRQLGMGHAEVLDRMSAEPSPHSHEILEALAAIERAEASDEIRVMSVAALCTGMILEEDLLSQRGLLLLARGQEITPTFAERLISFSYGLDPHQLCRVRIQNRKRQWPTS